MVQMIQLRHCSTAIVVLTLLILGDTNSALSQDYNRHRSSSGPIQELLPGVVSIAGIPHKIASVQTPEGSISVAIPSGTVPIQVGEPVVFSGREVRVGDLTFVNTRDGFIYRPQEMDWAQYMAAMQAQSQAYVDAAATAGGLNAVPTLAVTTPEQEAAAAARRRIDLLIALTSLLVGIVALERVPRALVWLKAKARGSKLRLGRRIREVSDRGGDSGVA